MAHENRISNTLEVVYFFIVLIFFFKRLFVPRKERITSYLHFACYALGSPTQDVQELRVKSLVSVDYTGI